MSKVKGFSIELVPAQVALTNACSKRLFSNIKKLHNHSIICTRQEELGNEAKVIASVLCNICSQLNNKPRVVEPYLNNIIYGFTTQLTFGAHAQRGLQSLMCVCVYCVCVCVYVISFLPLCASISPKYRYLHTDSPRHGENFYNPGFC